MSALSYDNSRLEHTIQRPAMVIISDDLPALTKLYIRLRETKAFLDEVAEEFIDAETV